MNPEEKKIKVKGDDLTQWNMLAYGIGHFLNDLCSACWFFFFSYYLVEIIKIGEYNAGYVMLAGQVSDAIATPLVGILSDKMKTPCGKRTPWYIFGTVIVGSSFTFLFVHAIPVGISGEIRLLYYILFASLFNIGWASVQVSHLSLLPSITLNRKHRDHMIRLRTGFTFIAQMSALVLSLIYFWVFEDKIFQYSLLSVSCVGLGLIASLIFLICCKEKNLSKNIPGYLSSMRSSLQERLSGQEVSQKDISLFQENPTGNGWCFWLKRVDFYGYMLVYIFCRLSLNLTQSVIPFYMELVLEYSKAKGGGTPIEIVIVLLISTFGALVGSLLIQNKIEDYISEPHQKRFILLFFSSFCVIIGCVPLYFLDNSFSCPIFGLAFFIGVGFSMGLSTVTSCISDIVGSKGDHSAFVYACYSFGDKVTSGVALLLIIPLIIQHSSVLKYCLPAFAPASLICALGIVLLREKLLESSEDDEEVMRKENENENENMKEEPSQVAIKSFIDDSRFTFVSRLDENEYCEEISH